MPGDNIVISMLGDADGNGAGGFAVLDAKTFEVKGRWENGGETPPFNYDFWYQPRKNALDLVASSASRTPTRRASTSPTSSAGPLRQRLHFWDLAERRLEQTLDLGERASSRSRCAGCTTPTPSRASSAPRSRARSGASTATTAAARPSP